ncbi:cytidine deaminase [Roseimaritima ulvae]|uniref:Cytidine deaminase n=1 Tax=Roseimaritima ulvae TaxID=980254 RepID=A0A5B9QX64_9BACT|nr:cytidine deaminase [Roseimaritima ulvae]QEG38543.1 Cytidine deaminase [Roseimaritima ulvae]
MPAPQPSPPQLAELIDAALDARRRAYAPYSRFAVGAAIRTVGGQIFQGCNVENASSGVGICAERTAGVAAVAAGEQEWQAIAIALRGGGTPCGVCRQFLSEFAAELTVISVDAAAPEHPYRVFQLAELYPHGFTRRDLAPSATSATSPPGDPPRNRS